MNPELLKKLLEQHGYVNIISINVTSGSTFQLHRINGTRTRYSVGFDFDNAVLILSQNADTSDTRFTVDYVDMGQVEAIVFNAVPVPVTAANSPTGGVTPPGFEVV